MGKVQLWSPILVTEDPTNRYALTNNLVIKRFKKFYDKKLMLESPCCKNLGL